MDNRAAGPYATVPGGTFNTAAGTTSFAAGSHAIANHDGSFVWADGSPGFFASTVNNEFSVRAVGGVRLFGNTGIGRSPWVWGGRGSTLAVQGPLWVGNDNFSGCHVLVGDDVCFRDFQDGKLSVRTFDDSAWTAVRASGFEPQSSIKLKKNVAPVRARDAERMLRLLEGLTLYRYRYKNESASRIAHTGVVAERSPAHILSDDRKALSLGDFAGVTAGATQALAARVRGLERKNAALARANAQLRRDVQRLVRQNARVTALERKVAQLAAHR